MYLYLAPSHKLGISTFCFTSALLPALVLVGSHAQAENAVTLPPTTVTATLTPTKLTDVVGDVLVITQDDIQAHQGQSALEVLAGQPSIQVKQSGGIGTQGSISLRGNRGEATLVLIDGMRYGSASNGAAALSLIPAASIERIEVLYGSAATSLYGSDAIGGVVQLFTSRASYVDNGQTSANLTLGGGSQHSYFASANFGAASASSRLNLGANYQETRGISAVTDPKNFVFESDKDGFDAKSVTINTATKLGSRTELSLTGLYAESTSQIDSGDAQGKSYVDQANGAGTLGLHIDFAPLKLELSHGMSVDEADTKTKHPSLFKTEQSLSKLKAALPTQAGSFTLGAEQLTQKLGGSTTFDKTKREMVSTLAGYQYVGDKIDVQANLRQDDIKDYKDNLNYSLGAAIEPKKGLRFGGSFATGFRLPTFNDLYYPGFSNPNLVPEESKSGEIFTNIYGEDFNTRLTVYKNDVDNYIMPDENYLPQNLTKADIRGVSLKSDWDIGGSGAGWFAGFFYDYLDAKDDATNKQIVYRAKHAGGVYTGLKHAQYRLKAEVAHTGKRFTNNENTMSLDGYTLLNLNGQLKISPMVDIALTVNNLLGEDYEPNKGYGALGTNATASVTFHTP